MRLTVRVLVLGGWSGQPRPHMRTVFQRDIVKLWRPFRFDTGLAKHQNTSCGCVTDVDVAESDGAPYAGHAVAGEADADRLRRRVDPIVLWGSRSHCGVRGHSIASRCITIGPRAFTHRVHSMQPGLFGATDHSDVGKRDRDGRRSFVERGGVDRDSTASICNERARLEGYVDQPVVGVVGLDCAPLVRVNKK